MITSHGKHHQTLKDVIYLQRPTRSDQNKIVRQGRELNKSLQNKENFQCKIIRIKLRLSTITDWIKFILEIKIEFKGHSCQQN